jgi:prepilin peptidase CpaA
VTAAVIGALALCAAAVVWDVRTRRIPNLLTLGGALAGLALHTSTLGLPGVWHSFSGWLVGCALFFPFFALGGMGAGDVKFLAAMGAWLGPSMAVFVALYAGIAGGGMAIVASVARGYFTQMCTNLWGLLMFWRVAGLQPMPGLTLPTAASPRLPYGLAIAAGTVTALWLR